jgi:phytanoyl-CoA hydroxylase
VPRDLTEAQLAQYERDGFLVFDELLPEEEVDALVGRLLVRVEHPIEGVRIEIEPELREAGNGNMASKLDSIRKVEKLVERDTLYNKLALHPLIFPKIQDILGDDELRLFRDALMMKPPHHGSAKPWHQDSVYWPIEPMDLCSIWLALEDATPENGCMRVLPGSHKGGPIEHGNTDGHLQVGGDALDTSNEVIAPLKKGGVLFFHSLVMHATSPNTSDHSRRAMVVSYMSANKHRHTGDPENEPDYMHLNAATTVRSALEG